MLDGAVDVGILLVKYGGLCIASQINFDEKCFVPPRLACWTPPKDNVTIVLSIVRVPHGRYGFAFVGFSPGEWRLIDKNDAQTTVPKMKRVSVSCARASSFC